MQVNPEKSLWWADIVLEGTAAEVLPKLVDEALKGDSSEKKARYAGCVGRQRVSSE